MSLLIGLGALLSACSNGGSATNDDRQFATDRHTEIPATETETPIPTPEEIPTLVSTPIATPLDSSARPISSVGTIYAVAEGGVIAVDVVTGNTRVITRNDRNGDIVRIGSSPNGDRVAVLRAHKVDKKTQYDLEVWSAKGKAIKTWKEAEARLDRVAEPGQGKALVDWSGDGAHIAVAFPDGGIVAFPVDGGDAIVLLTRGQAPGPMSMDWSPDGSVIAFASKSANGKGASLSLATVETLPVDPVRIAGTGGDRPIRGVWWLPDSSGVLAIQGRPNTAVEIGGDVVAVDRRTLTPHTVIGASRFGPTSAIVAAAPAPDGQTVAYAVVTADGFGGWVATVWIRQPDSSLVQVKLPPNPQVATIGWTAPGLATTLIEPDRVRVIVSSDDGQPVPVQPVIEATPLASPIAEASPIASPIAPPIAATPEAEASPVGSPFASPIASPEATPVVSR